MALWLRLPWYTNIVNKETGMEMLVTILEPIFKPRSG